jgi:acetate kinase
MAGSILTINGGSSSIKFAVYDPSALASAAPRRLAAGQVERIGGTNASLHTRMADEQAEQQQAVEAASHQHAIEHLIDWLQQRQLLSAVVGVGHRIVHGGPNYVQPCRVTPELILELKRLCSIDPAHLPGEIASIEAIARRFPQLPQVACFDTAFHRDMPRVASMLSIPRRYQSQGIRRYGFHGLSYTYLLQELERVAGASVARGRIVLAHLGAGASMAAVRDGQSIDTTMAFTPTAGLVMATRSGDLDPGLMIHLLREEKLSVDQLDDLVNRRSGLLGLSETSADMRDLLARRASDHRAAEAVDVFCYQARKWIGALAAALGGLDTLVFSGGIGEHAAEVRAGICQGLEFLGIVLDADANAAGAAVISVAGSPCTVRVIATDEEAMLASETLRILQA